MSGRIQCESSTTFVWPKIWSRGGSWESWCVCISWCAGIIEEWSIKRGRKKKTKSKNQRKNPIMGPEMKAPPVLFLVLVSCLLFQQSFAAGAPYTNPNLPVEARVKDLLGRMTVDEKIGQMIQIERSVATSAVITKYYIGETFKLHLCEDTATRA